MAENEKNIVTNVVAEPSINEIKSLNAGRAINYDQYLKIITRDLNNNKYTPVFGQYKKETVYKYLDNPDKNEKSLRQAINYIYGVSSHFRRLIQYFASLSDFSYVVTPNRVNFDKVNKNTLKNNYRKVIDFLSIMNLETQLREILTVCFREDVYYGTIWISKDSVVIQRLPSDYCAISTIEGGVLNVSFDFSYFDMRKDLLPYYPAEFKKKYLGYKSDGLKWVELDSPMSFAIKVNSDILDYAIPPFAGLLREIYGIEDYKKIQLDKAEIDNYALLAMYIPFNDKGEWGIDFDKAREFWSNLDSVMPDAIGSTLTPMKIEKISFERSHPGERDNIHEAEQNLFTAAGVSSLLFNNEKASANALTLSIKADQSITYAVVKSIEDMLNRLIQSQSYGKYFKLEMLDVSVFNRREVGDSYLKACQYGVPMVSHYCASQGVSQADVEGLLFVQKDILNISENFVPLKSSNTISSSTSSDSPTDDGGRPLKAEDELSESGEQNREDA